MPKFPIQREIPGVRMGGFPCDEVRQVGAVIHTVTGGG